MSVIVWSLLPNASRELARSEWAEAPISISTEEAVRILQARGEPEDHGWLPAAGRDSLAIDRTQNGAEAAD